MNTTKEQLVVNNMKLVYEVWNKEFRGQTDPEHEGDFIGDGFLALVMAAKTYDPDRGETKFSTYAYHCIRRKMLSRVSYMTYKCRDINKRPLSLEHEEAGANNVERRTKDRFIEALGYEDPVFEEIENRIYHEQIKDFVEEMLSTLTPEKREIIEYIFGLNGKPILKYEQIAEIYGKKNRSTIATMYQRTKRKLRNQFGERWAQMHGIQTG